MTRVKGGVKRIKRRQGITEHTKGFKWGRKSKIKLAKTAKMKAGQHAFASRRTKKRIARATWQIRINAAVRKLGLSYSELVGALKKQNILLDRKILAEMAAHHTSLFEKVVEASR